MNRKWRTWGLLLIAALLIGNGVRNYLRMLGPVYAGERLNVYFQKMTISNLMVTNENLVAFWELGADSVPFLERKLSSTNVQERQKAAWTIWRMGRIAMFDWDNHHRPVEPNVPKLLERLTDTDEEVRRYAVDALGETRPVSAEVVNALGARLRDADRAVRLRAAYYLGRMGGPANLALPRLVNAVHDPDSYVRGNSLEALARLSPDQALPLLIEGLGDDQQPPRLRSALWLGDLGFRATSAIPALRIALDDKNDQVRRAATNSIQKISAELAKQSQEEADRLRQKNGK